MRILFSTASELRSLDSRGRLCPHGSKLKSTVDKIKIRIRINITIKIRIKVLSKAEKLKAKAGRTNASVAT